MDNFSEHEIDELMRNCTDEKLFCFIYGNAVIL